MEIRGINPFLLDVRRWRGSGLLARLSRRRGLLALLLGASFLALHLPFLAPTPGGIDSVNFALGVRDFNVADHRPHPPGYPVFIALGKASKAMLASWWPATKSVRAETRALAIWSALFGALAVFPLLAFFRGLEMNNRRAVAATALVLTCPLFWFMAVRAMSDMPGLTAALVAQALLVTAFRHREEGKQKRDAANPLPGQAGDRPRVATPDRMIVAGALVAGIAIGFRSQAVWLTVPLLVMVLLHRRDPAGTGPLSASAAAFAVGVLLWAVPLMIGSGGPHAYFATLAAQGSEDLTAVDLLATNPTFRGLVRGLVHTFAFPWADRRLAFLVLGLAVAGAVTMLARGRAGLVVLVAAAAPYAAFHLMFQEAVTIRYGLPLVPTVAYLAVRGLDALGGRLMKPLACGLVAACLVVAVPPVILYARAGSPAYRALADVERRLAHEKGVRPVLASHHSIARALRGEALSLRMLPSPPKHEWLEVAKYWRDGGNAPLWFLAEPGRTDLALIDRASRRLVRSYGWPFTRRAIVRGVRPEGVVWYEINRPSWVAAEGWALTPEAAGVARKDRRGPGEGPIVAFVRRRAEAAVLMVGGRNLGQRADPDARIEVSIDGRKIDSWVATRNPRFFLRTWPLPAGTLMGPDGYTRLCIRSAAADGSGRRPRVGIEQFDLQSAGSVVYGFDTGWYEQEYDPLAAKLWRWTGGAATLRVHPWNHDLTLRVTGELPLRYLDAPPRVVVRAGSEILGRFAPGETLSVHVRVPARALIRSGGLLTIETDRTFVPDEVLHNGDRRRLGLRIFSLQLQ